MSQAFRNPDWRAPLDVGGYFEGVPAKGSVKGRFFRALVGDPGDPARPRVGQERYLAFRDYPMREYLELLLETARVRYPGIPHREALRRIGSGAYTLFEGT